MSYQVLARKYRPQRFSDVIGQDHVTRTLKNAIEQQRIAHGYIFSGHRGIGKTTIARILAMALNCHGADGRADRPQLEPCGVCASCRAISSSTRADVDSLSFEETHSLNYEEIDAATNRGIDEARRLIDKVRSRPAGNDRYRIIVLDEAHQITDAAFNSMLKIFEEPPSWAIFMMATTQPEDIPQTIRSRCQHFSFHPVKFTEIMGQLRDICQKEGIQAEEEALAVLAEAGDGSMRDALSIMDQAIACCGTNLSAELVRGLAGTVGSEVLEDLMGAVSRNSSADALRLLDRLMMEGQNPSHFAKQLVRFLRNAVVAKVAGDASSLLQISSDERARVGRVAAQFGEEELARFLQIMLRTHDDLGYRQEQRFHLELGVLKMVHAQRILPMEQVLSQLAPEGQKTLATNRQAATSSQAVSSPAAAPVRKTESASPFEADRARKIRSSEPQMSEGPTIQAQSAAAGTAVAVAARENSDDPSKILGYVLNELENAGHKTLASVLETGSVALTGNELTVTVARTPSVIDVLMGAEQKRAANAAASAVAGRPLKVVVVSGMPGNGAAPVVRPSGTNRTSARSRAAEDPVVRCMQEKFGAEIRTVIDHREKN